MNFRFYAIIGFMFLLAGFLLNPALILDIFNHGPEKQNAASVVHATPASNNSNNSEVAKNGIPVGSISGQPTSLEIPSLNISLPVQPGYYNSQNQTWTISRTAAYYAAVTSEPNNVAGNTLIYGHNRASIFRDLKNLNTGDRVTITTVNNHVFTYEYAGTQTTDPRDVSILSYQGKPRLTLQTCSGAFYQNRQFFFFNLIEAR